MMAEQAAPAAHHWQHVLEPCIDYIDNAATLLRVLLAGHAQKSHVVGSVQQHLPRLLRHELAALQTRECTPIQVASVLAPVDWLLITAGCAAVNTPAVAETLLSAPVASSIPVQRALPGLCMLHGLRVSLQQVVEASRQRIKRLDLWLQAAHSITESSRGIPAHITQLGFSDREVSPVEVPM
jgi:hypothetical protein